MGIRAGRAMESEDEEWGWRVRRESGNGEGLAEEGKKDDKEENVHTFSLFFCALAALPFLSHSSAFCSYLAAL